MASEAKREGELRGYGGFADTAFARENLCREPEISVSGSRDETASGWGDRQTRMMWSTFPKDILGCVVACAEPF